MENLPPGFTVMADAVLKMYENGTFITGRNMKKRQNEEATIIREKSIKKRSLTGTQTRERIKKKKNLSRVNNEQGN